MMRNLLALLLVAGLACLTLTACEGDPSDQYRYSKPDDLSIVTPSYSFPDSSVDEVTQKLTETAVHLLNQDAVMIDLVLNGYIGDGEYLDEETDAENYTQVLSNTFPSFVSVKEKINEIYANDESANFFLSFPNAEKPRLKGDDKSLYVLDDEDIIKFPAYVDVQEVTILDHTDTSATIEFTYRGPDYFYFDSNEDMPFPSNRINMYLVDGVWKLDTSFYQYYAANNPDMPWVTQSYSSSSAVSQ